MAGETVEREGTRRPGLPLDRLPVDGETLAGIGTILPVIALYTIISIIPVGFAVWASLHEIPLLNPEWTWVGVGNYGQVFQVDRFWGSLGRGVVFMIGSTLLQLVVGLWMALTLNRLATGQKIITAVVFTAYLIPTVVVSLLALFMFDTFFGVFHEVGAEWLGYERVRARPARPGDAVAYSYRLVEVLGVHHHLRARPAPVNPGAVLRSREGVRRKSLGDVP